MGRIGKKSKLMLKMLMLQMLKMLMLHNLSLEGGKL